MNPAHKTLVVMAFVAVALLLLLSGTGLTTGVVISGGVMEGGGISWTWLPSLLFVAVGMVLFSVTVGRK